MAAYRNAWGDPDCIRGMCADYRAALTYDFDDDSADQHQQVTCPALVLYGADGAIAKAYDVPHTWATRLKHQSSRALPGGHFFVDQHPGATAEVLLEFLRSL